MQTSGTFPGLSDGMGKMIVKPKKVAIVTDADVTRVRYGKPMTAEAPRTNTHRRGGQAAKGK